MSGVPETPVRVVRVHAEEDRASARSLFRELAQHFGSLGFEIEPERIAAELDPGGPFEEPTGCVLLAHIGDDAVGCVAVRRAEWDVTGQTSEMRRMYVRPPWRGRGVARALAVRLLEEARGLGYARMILATHSSFTPALDLYASIGFERMTPPREASWEDVVFMERAL